jgi:5-oxoprolinase (ATP-hydrolysing) subunit C
VIAIVITRAGPLCTVQDAGRFGMLRHGVSASGPMDRAAFERCAIWLGGAGAAGIEFTRAGFTFTVDGGGLGAAFDGGVFTLRRNGETSAVWPTRLMLRDGDIVEISPGPYGNYGYVRFDRELNLPALMGSQATNTVAGLGGFEGRALRAGDRMEFGETAQRGMSLHPSAAKVEEGPIRVIWGLHADLFDAGTRERFAGVAFRVSTRIDRMGARLEDGAGVFSGQAALSLVSDAVVAGDIQILGEGTPIVLLRDHQPTGGYPRIATVVSADFDRFAQMRPGTEVRFEPMTLQRAHALMRGRTA